jgi:hypothetical protein
MNCESDPGHYLLSFSSGPRAVRFSLRVTVESHECAVGTAVGSRTVMRR